MPLNDLSRADRSARPAPVASPAAVTEAELLDFARRTAADPEVLARLPLDPVERTWLRLKGPGGSEAWLIGWPPGAETGWHDHGGSRGAFATAVGELTEDSVAVPLPTAGWQRLELTADVDRTRRLPVGRGRAFGPYHVHQVVNASEEDHAVSVHVYYPPLPMMRRYSRSGRVLRLALVERPQEW
ncbi:cysteine dioxygenase [Streptantibioticus rubrisoli]|uniref:Cysteine dioxygenase n=1 Tax=Streptantibioticus rubrisoli TaxID=1387313 RepID=A0ABT1PI76_9ACTN|nr:cysteine dioxygenase [Streptantibioticus rubrisoli]MCQ4045062.1 cysteine dioxygenase [Streptantibioticus rubrisoli]